jgi:hypothetical protein
MDQHRLDAADKLFLRVGRRIDRSFGCARLVRRRWLLMSDQRDGLGVLFSLAASRFVG